MGVRRTSESGVDSTDDVEDSDTLRRRVGVRGPKREGGLGRQLLEHVRLSHPQEKLGRTMIIKIKIKEGF